MYKKEGREKRRKKKSLQRVRETKRERGGVESRDERAERECAGTCMRIRNTCVLGAQKRGAVERERSRRGVTVTMGMLFCGESGICGTLSVDGGTRWRDGRGERGGVGLEREERIYYGAGVLRIARGTSRFNFRTFQTRHVCALWWQRRKR